MKNLLVFISALLLTVGFSNDAFSQIKLISVDTKQKAIGSMGDKIPLSINKQVLSEKQLREGDRFLMDAHSMGTVEMEIKRIKEFIPGTISYQVAATDNQEQLFSFTYANGVINGIFHKDHEEAIFFMGDEEKNTTVMTNNKSHFPEELGCSLHNNEENFGSLNLLRNQKSKAGAQSKQTSGSAALMAVGNDTTVIDIMLVYTNTAEKWALTSEFRTIDVVLAQAMNLSQTAIDNSKLPIELNVVHVYETDYDDDNSATDAADHLRRFSQNDAAPVFGSQFNGYMEEVHALRDQYGADLMALIMSEPNTGGIAWLLRNTSGTPAYGFSVNRVQQVASGYTLIHEIGHNMGNSHSRTQAASNASGAGGLFQFSVGYQNSGSGFVTVMAYEENGWARAPLFSSPDLSFGGVQAGSNDGINPVNNAKSMDLIKRTMSKYRSTGVTPPTVSLSTENIAIDLNREDEFNISIDITNGGLSPLMWEVDFDFADAISSSAKRNENFDESIQVIPFNIDKDLPVNFHPVEETLRSKSSVAESSIIYSSSFETTEGYVEGKYSGIKEWRSLSGSDINISSSNPNTGSGHMRLEYTEGSTQFISGPFIGYLPFGSYEAEISFSISGDNTDNLYDIQFFEGKTNEYSVYSVISNNILYTGSINESGGISFTSTGAAINPDTYYTYKVVFNISNNGLDHYLNDTLIAQTGFLNGYRPGYVRLLNRNTTPDAFMDVDDIVIRENEAPNSWIDIERENLVGFARNNQSGTIDFTINTYGLEAGEYSTTMLLTTNDPTKEEIEIPIDLTVNQAVSTETFDGPESIKLEQNYPNPFNPTTTINYSLATPQNVSLDIFNIQGQKVATVQNENVGAGPHSVTFDASNLSSGIYVYRLKTASQTLIRQMVLIK